MILTTNLEGKFFQRVAESLHLAFGRDVDLMGLAQGNRPDHTHMVEVCDRMAVVLAATKGLGVVHNLC